MRVSRICFCHKAKQVEEMAKKFNLPRIPVQHLSDDKQILTLYNECMYHANHFCNSFPLKPPLVSIWIPGMSRSLFAPIKMETNQMYWIRGSSTPLLTANLTPKQRIQSRNPTEKTQKAHNFLCSFP